MSNEPGYGLRVAVLGRVRAWIDGNDVALGPARQRAVLAVLAANANRDVSRDWLVRAVWGPAAPPTANGSVYTYVCGLRRALALNGSPGAGAGLLISGPSGYSLRLAEGALDTDRFTRMRADAQRRLADGAPADAAAVLDEALGLWHGEAYSGVTGPFVELDRQRLAELRLSALEQRARIAIDLGAHDDVVAQLTGLIREHPLNEALRELLMLALHRAGRPTEALAEYRSARQILIRELCTEPGPALQELHRQILNGSAAVPADAPAAGPAHNPGPGRPAPTAPAARSSVVPDHVARAISEGPDRRVFVGRRTEVAILRRFVKELATGTGRAVWIEGDPGIGKSELLTAAFSDATRHGCQLAWSVADELGQRVPLHVVTMALAVETTSPDPRIAALAAQLCGAADPAGAVLAFVRELCADAPLIMVVDDMQWADDASRLVWERLAAVSRRLPLLVVAAARPEPNSRELSQLRRGVRARDGAVLELTALSSPDVEHLIGAIVGATPGASLRALVPRVAGNPMYTRELVSPLLARSAVTVLDGVAEIDPQAADEVPESLLAAVRGTLTFLSEDTHFVLRLAALLGMEFSVAHVAALTGRPPHDLVPVFEEAVAGQVVVDAGGRLAFRHPFLRQALSDGIPRAIRASLHRHAAEALARTDTVVTGARETGTGDQHGQTEVHGRP